MLVVDTSAVIGALVGDPSNERLVARLGSERVLHAPHLIDVEALHALRRLVRTGALDAARAEAARDDYRALSILRYPHVGLLDRMWQLRENVTSYDAAFVALSEALDAPLLTIDARLQAASGHHAEIEAP